MAEFVHLHNHSHFSLLDGGSHPEVLVARADKALYQAKDMGRNMVQVSKINLE